MGLFLQLDKVGKESGARAGLEKQMPYFRRKSSGTVGGLEVCTGPSPTH